VVRALDAPTGWTSFFHRRVVEGEKHVPVAAVDAANPWRTIGSASHAAGSGAGYANDHDDQIDIVLAGSIKAAERVRFVVIPAQGGGYQPFYNPGPPPRGLRTTGLDDAHSPRLPPRTDALPDRSQRGPRSGRGDRDSSVAQAKSAQAIHVLSREWRGEVRAIRACPVLEWAGRSSTRSSSPRVQVVVDQRWS